MKVGNVDYTSITDLARHKEKEQIILFKTG